jgi:MerR family transcriptional regulator, copper efflux regulator
MDNLGTQRAGISIGAVAKNSGISVKTIRYYEELGLLNTIGRTEGGYRLFGAQVFERLNFIKRCQNLGLSLAEIGELLAIHDRGELPCDRVEQKLRDKLADIDRQIQELKLLGRELEGLLADRSVRTKPSGAKICPIIEQ